MFSTHARTHARTHTHTHSSWGPFLCCLRFFKNITWQINIFLQVLYILAELQLLKDVTLTECLCFYCYYESSCVWHLFCGNYYPDSKSHLKRNHYWYMQNKFDCFHCCSVIRFYNQNSICVFYLYLYVWVFLRVESWVGVGFC